MLLHDRVALAAVIAIAALSLFAWLASRFGVDFAVAAMAFLVTGTLSILISESLNSRKEKRNVRR